MAPQTLVTGRTSRTLAAALKLRCTECGKVGRFEGSSCRVCHGTRFEPAPWQPFSRAAK